MSFHNSKNVSKCFKSPLKDDAKPAPLVEKSLVEEYQALAERESSLDHDISILSTASTPSDVKIVMDLLHRFNEVKDATQIVLGRLASVEGKTLQQMHERFGLNDKE